MRVRLRSCADGANPLVVKNNALAEENFRISKKPMGYQRLALFSTFLLFSTFDRVLTKHSLYFSPKFLHLSDSPLPSDCSAIPA